MRSFKDIIDWYFSKGALPYWCVLLIDCIILLFSSIVVYWAFYSASFLVGNFLPLMRVMLIYLAVTCIFYRVFKTYTGIIRYSSFSDLIRIGMAMACSYIVAFLIHYPLSATPAWLFAHLTARFLLVTFVLATALMWLARIVIKAVYDAFFRTEAAQAAFIYGIRAGGIGLAKSIRGEKPMRFKLRGFISHDPSLRAKGTVLMGEPVFDVDDSLPEELQKRRIKAVLVAPGRIDRFRNDTVLQDYILSSGAKIYFSHAAVEGDKDSLLGTATISEVKIEDLLPRDEIQIDMDSIAKDIRDKKILITGSAGSIGSEIVHQVASFGPSEMMLIDSAETPQHDIRLMMAREYPAVKTSTIVTSIVNESHMEAIFRDFRPDYVFHAAAYKHVPMMEYNPSESIQNNVQGTKIIADLSVKYGVSKFVMISTDKAVNPTNVMGCSKRICEIYCQALNKFVEEKKKAGGEGSPCTQFVTTRFGNVLGSNGSVIPIFKEQIAKGGPVTVTHPDIIRYFMLIPEACKLVLEAGTMGKGGEIFVFDMGKPVRIADLAQRMITLSGAKNCQIQYTGLRDGEKLYEEVLNDAEHTLPTVHPKIMVAKVREYDYEKACQDEERLLEASYTGDDMAIVKIMKEIVPEFKSRHSKYEALD